MKKFDDLNGIVTDIIEIDQYHGQYGRVARVVARTLAHLNLHFIPFNLYTQEFTVQSNFTVKLPSLWTDVMKVGVCQPNGELCIFGRNDNLCMLGKEDTLETLGCSCDTKNKEAAADDSAAPMNDTALKPHTCDMCTFHYVHGGIGELYGYRVPQFENGTFRYDPYTNIIALGSGTDVYPGATVVVEGVYADGTERKMIPTSAFMMVRQFVLKMLNESTPSISSAHLREFKMELDLFKDTHMPSLQDIIASFRGNYQSSIKG